MIRGGTELLACLLIVQVDVARFTEIYIDIVITHANAGTLNVLIKNLVKYFNVEKTICACCFVAVLFLPLP